MVLRLQVWLGEVLPSNTSVIASIRSLEPYTISWSNVPDFMPPADFHKLAKAVSAPNETVHYMHRCCGSDFSSDIRLSITDQLPTGYT